MQWTKEIEHVMQKETNQLLKQLLTQGHVSCGKKNYKKNV
jgi:hypothetical protein